MAIPIVVTLISGLISSSFVQPARCERTTMRMGWFPIGLFQRLAIEPA